MPWGFECRAKLIKQLPAKPTQRRGEADTKMPGPMSYDPPEVFCGKGFSHIKRAPAYTFGHMTPAELRKPATTPFAKMFNVQGLSPRGPYQITHGVVTPHIEPVGSTMKVPGPGQYEPKFQLRYKRPPAYGLRLAAKPPYEPWDMWTPPPNMYCPPIPAKKPPAYTIGYAAPPPKGQQFPGPGEHDPNFKYVKRNSRQVSFGAPYRASKKPEGPAPNAYCEKKFMYPKRTIPAPSFGIKHSPYIGQQETYLKSSKMNLLETS